MTDPRTAIWRWARQGIPEGQILPVWLRRVRAVLFPLQAFYWRMSGHTGYRFEDDTWLIHGIRFSSESLLQLSTQNGTLLRVVNRDGELVTIERVQP